MANSFSFSRRSFPFPLDNKYITESLRLSAAFNKISSFEELPAVQTYTGVGLVQVKFSHRNFHLSGATSNEIDSLYMLQCFKSLE